MDQLRLQSASQQVAAHLRSRLQQGTWTGQMPGVKQLTEQLGVNHKTVEAALAQLERDGVLAGQGPRRRRRIVAEKIGGGTRSLRIAFLTFSQEDRLNVSVMHIYHCLVEAGHSPFFTRRTLEEFDFDQKRVARFAEGVKADAWLVLAGSREVLEWFGQQEFPVMALFGRWGQAQVAGVGPKKTPAYEHAVERLVALGHKRIVMLARSQRIRPKPGAPEQAFLDALGSHGLPVNADYNLPLWENNQMAFHQRLESLFRVTPPSALIVQEAILLSAVQQFLATRGLRVPADVSLICAEGDPNFAWQVPTIAHIRMDSAPWARHILRWAKKISNGQQCLRQLSTKVEFVPGGTIGPPRNAM